MDIQEALENPLPVLSASVKELVIEAKIEAAEARQVSFDLKNTKSGALEGSIISPAKSLVFEPQKWKGNRQTIRCTFSPDPMEGWKPGDVRTFSALILSNGGELHLPVTVRLAKMAISTHEGISIVNLQDFYAYSMEHPQKAQDLFAEKEFHKLLTAMDFLYTDAYLLLTEEPNRALALDNFFILAGLKSRTKLFVPEPVIEHVSRDYDIIHGQFEIQKSDKGYIEANISTLKNSPWLSLTFEDFTVKYSIDPKRINSRYAQERIIIRTPDSEEQNEASVDIIFKRPLPISAYLSKEGYRFSDEGAVVVENHMKEPLVVEVFCQENFVRFYEQKYKVEAELKIPFLIKLSTLQSAQMLFRKVPSLSTEIEIKTVYDGKNIKKTLPLTAGEW